MEAPQGNANQLVRIDDDCDEHGTNEDNLALGERRAKAAMSYLVSKGIPADRTTVVPTATSVRSVTSTTRVAERGIAAATSSPSPSSPAGMTYLGRMCPAAVKCLRNWDGVAQGFPSGGEISAQL